MKPAKPFSTTMDEQTFVPPTMRALYYTMPAAGNKANSSRQGEASRALIFDSDFPVPRPSSNQYLIKVQAAAFSHDEIHLARTLNPTQCMPQIPLHNICGIVISTPSEDHLSTEGPKFKVDDVVFGLVSYARDGGAADYIVATEDELAFKPKNISAVEAAAIPLPALSAWKALFTYGGLEPGDDDNGTVHAHSTGGGGTHKRSTGSISSISSTNSNQSSLSMLSSTISNGSSTTNAQHVPNQGHGHSIGQKLRSKYRNHPLRMLITNAGDCEIALQALDLLRSTSMFPCNSGNNDNHTPKPWICVTCTSSTQATDIRAKASVNETIVMPLPLDKNDFNLAGIFRDNHWEPVDIVLDCVGGQVLRQTYSPYIVRDHGAVLTAVDHGLAQYPDRENDNDNGNGMERGLFGRFVAVEPDGETLGRIAALVEEGSVKGRVAKAVDLVHGQDVLGGVGVDGIKGGEMIVVRVNSYW